FSFPFIILLHCFSCYLLSILIVNCRLLCSLSTIIFPVIYLSFLLLFVPYSSHSYLSTIIFPVIYLTFLLFTYLPLFLPIAIILLLFILLFTNYSYCYLSTTLVFVYILLFILLFNYCYLPTN
ncbi:hypothetical protein LOAG_15079, partial [Loa loa]